MKSNVLLGLLFVLVHFALGHLGLTMATLNHNASPIWPAAGFALFILTHYGLRYFPYIWIGAFLTNLLTPIPLLAALGIASANASEAIVSAILFGGLMQSRWKDDLSTHYAPISLFVATLVGSVVGATIGNLSLVVSGVIPVSEVLASWSTWLLGDFLGAVMLFPVLKIFWSSKGLRKLGEDWRWMLLGLGVCYGVGSLFMWAKFGSPWVFIIFYLSLAGFYYKKVEVVYFWVLVFYVWSIWSTLHRVGPFSHGDINANFVYLQIYFACFALSLEFLKTFLERGVLRPTGLVLAVGWLALAVSYSSFINSEILRDVNSFSELVAEGEESVQSQMAMYEGILRSAAGFVSARESFTRAEWMQFVDTVDVKHRFRGIRGIGFIERAPLVNRQGWLRRIKQEYGKKFEIRNLPGKGAPPTAEQFVITRIEPIERNQSALGLNLFSEKRRYEALQKAILTKSPTATDPITLVQDEKKRAGFLFFVPVYSRDNRLLGVVYAPIVYQELLGASLEAVLPQLNVMAKLIVDNGAQEAVYSSDNFSLDAQGLNTEMEMKILDKSLSLTWQVSENFLTSMDVTGAWVMGIGGLLCLLIAVVMGNIRLIGAHAQRAADKATADLRLSQLQLVRSAKFSALGEMAGGIAHEINNPLSIILARVEQIQRVAKQDKIEPKKLLDLADSIAKTVKRISTIVVGLKTFSRSGDGEEFALVNLKNLVDETVSFCHDRSHQMGVEISVEGIDGVSVPGRHTQLSQVLLNLLNNALDAASAQDTKWIRITGELQGSFYLLRVTDSGAGISAEVVDKLMQPFFTTKEIGKGTGLGLSLSKGIMEDHKGELLYLKHQGHTSFVMKIPIKNENALKLSAA
jgi:signal transduction histidine kinase/integral membrane sensor domain MASE1